MAADCATEIVIELIDCLKIGILYYLIFDGKFTRKIERYLLGIALICVVNIGDFVFYQGEHVWFLRLVLLVSAYTFLQGKVFTKIFYVLLLDTIINILDALISFSISYLIIGRVVDTYNNHFVHIGLEILNTAVYFIIGNMIRKILRKDRLEIIPQFRFFILMLVDIICCFLVVGGTGLLLEGTTGTKVRMIITVGIIIMCVILMIQSFMQNYYFNSRNYYRELLKNKEKYMETKYRYYENQQKNYEEMHKLNHDMKKHFRYIRELNHVEDRESIENYILQIGEKMEHTMDIVDCGNSIVTAIVTDAANLAKKEQIDFICEGHCPEKLNISEMDMCILLGNILENAIESAGAYREKYVKIQFYCAKNKLVIKVENSTDKEGTKKDMKLVSGKRGNHGLGMGNVMEVVHKYKGDITWEVKNHVFKTEVII